jgi:hypothetical protein
MGMSRQCLWQNNRATLQGHMVFYNKKNIQIFKAKVLKNRLAFTMFWELVNQLQPSRLDVWDKAKPVNQNTHLYGRHALRTYAAHGASTQHNNKRVVMLGALMASTGKSEIIASAFTIASIYFL